MDKLDQTDVLRLMQGKSVVPRIATAAKISSLFRDGELSSEEVRIAEDILRLMVQDAEVRVREALVGNLKDNKSIPRDVAERLASDVESVALPILTLNPALQDDFLIEIVKERDQARQLAIAGRLDVSARVSGALVDFGDENVVWHLMGNSGATMEKDVLARSLDRFGDSEAVTSSMAQRAELPISISERLVTLVSESMRKHILLHHPLTADTTAGLIANIHDDATYGLAEDQMSGRLVMPGIEQPGAAKASMTVEALVSQLTAMGRLTPAIVMRALCLGNLAFFETAIARRLRTERAAVSKDLRKSKSTIDDLCYRAGLPKHLTLVVRVALCVEHNVEYEGSEQDREAFVPSNLRILAQRFDASESREIEVFLRKLSRLNYD